MSSRLKIVLTEDVKAEISSAVRCGEASSSSPKICVGWRVFVTDGRFEGAKKATVVDARVVRRASLIVSMSIVDSTALRTKKM